MGFSPPELLGKSCYEFIHSEDQSHMKENFDRVINLMGFSPPELLGKSCYEFIHSEDQSHMKENFDQVIKMKGQVMTLMYRFRAKNNEWIWLRTSAFAFLNPY